MPKRFALIVFSLLFAASVARAADPVADFNAEIKAVEHLRQRTFLHAVTHKTVDRKDLPAIMKAEMLKGLPYSPEDYIVVLRSLQLVDDEPKLLERLLDLYQQQVLAFYDPLEHVYYSIAQPPDAIKDENLPELEESVAVHELTHALQDQRFHAGDMVKKVSGDWDAELAYDSLIEGEATLVMLDHLFEKSGYSIDDVMKSDALVKAIATAAGANDKTMPEGTPRYFEESLKFPYLEGLNFVIAAYRHGGWSALDAAHANPPRNTREILHPDEYFARTSRSTPAAADTVASTIPGTVAVEHMGEFHWRFLLGDGAGRGWVSDRAVVVRNARKEITVLVESRWENEAAAKAFRDSYVAFLAKRGLDAKSAQQGAVVRVGYGADAALIAQKVAPPAAATKE